MDAGKVPDDGGSLDVRGPTIGVAYAVVMVVVVVGVDLLVFRGRTWTWERLAANVGIVLLFGACYFRFLR